MFNRTQNSETEIFSSLTFLNEKSKLQLQVQVAEFLSLLSAKAIFRLSYEPWKTIAVKFPNSISQTKKTNNFFWLYVIALC